MYIGIIGAMDSEIAFLLEKMQEVKVNKIGPFVYYNGEIYSKQVVAVQCLEGKVNAAICTQLLIENFDIEYVLNIGVAGAIDKRLSIGGIALSSATVEFDNDTTALGYELGHTFGLDKTVIECSETILSRIYHIAKEKENVLVGVIASSDRFVEDNITKNMLKDKFNAIAVDMETAAINHVCALNNIRFCAIRAISDNGSKVEFKKFLENALDSINRIIFEFLKNN
ncbi:MAG: 5'-methylthioadenosine/adenosylhomocysteine nucleosidase [Clostridia bacterium]|nr:5'-methylthioadenosine/adenosylhomocysteine nucleosidase [Clostridia bacterium]